MTEPNATKPGIPVLRLLFVVVFIGSLMCGIWVTLDHFFTNLSVEPTLHEIPSPGGIVEGAVLTVDRPTPAALDALGVVWCVGAEATSNLDGHDPVHATGRRDVYPETKGPTAARGPPGIETPDSRRWRSGGRVRPPRRRSSSSRPITLARWSGSTTWTSVRPST